MLTAILNHKVKDYAIWRPYFDADIERRKKFGITGEKVFRSFEEPNHLYIKFEANDPSAIDKLLGDPELPAKMEGAGVISKPEFTLLKEA